MNRCGSESVVIYRLDLWKNEQIVCLFFKRQKFKHRAKKHFRFFYFYTEFAKVAKLTERKVKEMDQIQELRLKLGAAGEPGGSSESSGYSVLPCMVTGQAGVSVLGRCKTRNPGQMFASQEEDGVLSYCMSAPICFQIATSGFVLVKYNQTDSLALCLPFLAQTAAPQCNTLRGCRCVLQVCIFSL